MMMGGFNMKGTKGLKISSIILILMGVASILFK